MTTKDRVEGLLNKIIYRALNGDSVDEPFEEVLEIVGELAKENGMLEDACDYWKQYALEGR